MASRRVRIKGIANIPQRKKAGAAEAEGPPEDGPKNEPDRCEDEPNLTTSHVRRATTETAVETVETSNKSTTGEHELETKVGGNEQDTRASADDVAVKSDAINVINNIEAQKGTKPLPVRRKFIKPAVALKSLSRKKETPENVTVEPNKENVQEAVNINLNETVIAPNISPTVKSDQTPVPLTVKISPTFVPQKEISKCGSDTEYPPPPVSPSKLLNRRIKAVPKLHQRRTSFSIGSASESEDDGRRSTYGRVRNDSVCSVASVTVDTPVSMKEAVSPTRKEAAGSNPPRKFRRTEQGRKIAEARRSFYQKFGDGKPDKQKLTMIDLIYYNPATNPMNPRKRRETTSTVSEEAPSPKADDEGADDPTRTNSEAEDEDEAEDNDVLAPQIKVGPNGEIVIDEKSLVIENVETKRSRQAMETAEVIDGDFDTSYGVVKRVKRSKDWSNEETLRFYKALNTIGTDFTMMCELFPNRTRRELKLKFKREEKVNKALVDRAVMQPVEFDMSHLRKDLEEHERFVEEKKKRVEETKLAKEKERQRRLEKKYERKKSLARIDTVLINELEEVMIKKDQKPKRKRKKKKHPYDDLKKGINTLLEDTDDSDEEYRPTSTEKNIEEKRASKPREVKNIPTDESGNAQNLELGSLMIIPSSQSGKTLYKVFMITEEQSRQDGNTDNNAIEKIASNAGKVVNVQNIITISENAVEDPHVNPGGNIDITKDSIIFPFDECPVPANNNPNITISHDDNKMTIITEN